jgi:hypothetical protein
MTEAEGAIRRARIPCGAVLVLLAGFLALAPKPWDAPGGPGFLPADRRPL